MTLFPLISDRGPAILMLFLAPLLRQDSAAPEPTTPNAISGRQLGRISYTIIPELMSQRGGRVPEKSRPAYQLGGNRPSRKRPPGTAQDKIQ